MPTIGSTTSASPIPQFLDGGTKTGAFTAVEGATYQVNLTSGLGAQAVTLPTTPAQGTLISVNRIDTNFYTSFVTITPGGADSMDGGGANFNLSAGGVLLVYQGTSWRVIGYGTGGYSGLAGITAAVGFPGNIMSRDSTGRSSVIDPVNTDQITNRNYVDTKAAVLAPSYAAYGQAAGQSLLSGQFDLRRSVYNLHADNTRNLRRGLAMAARGGMSVQLVIGDSISSGAVSGVGTTLYDRPNAWPMAMRNALAGMGVPVGGTGIVRPIDNTSTDARYSSTGTWANNGVYIFSTVVSSTLTYSPDLSGSIVDVQYYNGAAGTFTISVNGVVVRTVTGSGAATWGHARLTGQNIVANQSKIVITQTVVNTTGIIIAGIDVFTPNTGLRMVNVAQSGSRASGNTGVNSWTDTTSTGNSASPYKTFGDSAGRLRAVSDAAFTAASKVMTSASSTFTADNIGDPIDMPAVPTAGIVIPENVFIGSINSATSVNMRTIINGVEVDATAYRTVTAQSVNVGRDPHVVHLAIGGNDMIQLGITALAATRTALTTLRTNYPNSDVVLHLFHNVTTTLVSQADQDSFAAMFYALADPVLGLDLPLFDWRDRIGTYAQAQASGIMGDYQVHLKGWGYAMIGSLLAEVIGESAGPTQGIYPIVRDTDLTTKKYVDDKTKQAGATTAATILTTVEQVVMQLALPANSLKVGAAYEYAMALKPAIAAGTTVRVRIGTAGTISDAAVVTMSVTPAQTSALARYCEGVGVVTAIGASAAHTGVGNESIHGIVPAVGNAGAVTTAGTFDSTKDNILSITVQNNTSTTTTLHAGRVAMTP